jgi:hypothetical protein
MAIKNHLVFYSRNGILHKRWRGGTNLRIIRTSTRTFISCLTDKINYIRSIGALTLKAILLFLRSGLLLRTWSSPKLTTSRLTFSFFNFLAIRINSFSSASTGDPMKATILNKDKTKSLGHLNWYLSWYDVVIIFRVKSLSYK